MRTLFMMCAVSSAFCLAGDCPAQEGSWSQFRGNGGQGVATGDAALPVEFGPEQGVIWKTALGPGHSSPCLWGDRIFLTEYEEEQLSTVCIDRTNGKVLWRSKVTPPNTEHLHRTNSPASPTPVADGERVFVYFGSFGLLCYDFAGKEVWRRPLATPKNTFGTAASPILAGGRLIFCSDTNEESFLEAIDPATGETVWKVDRTGLVSGWSTPVLWHRGGVDELVVYGVWWMKAYDLKDGSERWSVPGLTDEPIITPAISEDMVFVTSYNMKTNTEVIGLPEFSQLLKDYDADGNGRLNRDEVEPNQSILSRFDADGEGDHPLRGFFRFLDVDKSGEITAKEWEKIVAWVDGFKHANAVLAIRPTGTETEIVWQHARGVPECPSPLYYQGRIFLVKNGGIATCLDAETGALLFEERLDSRGPHYASPVAGDGKIYTASARGQVTVIEAGSSLKVLARNDLGERIMATPALMDGRVYVRTEEQLFAFGTPD